MDQTASLCQTLLQHKSACSGIAVVYCTDQLLPLKTDKAENRIPGAAVKPNQNFLTCLHEPFAELLRKLSRKPGKQSKGRRRLRHEQIFQETLRQVMAGEADHLDDLTYDPVIL